MPRVFIAVDFPPHLKERIANMCFGLRGARWVPMEQMHLTLRFVGEVDESQFEEIADALHGVEAERFRLFLKGCGFFPPKRSPKTLWVGVRRNPSLQALHGKIESALERVGVAREKRRFHPHVTIARFKHTVTSADVMGFVKANSLFTSMPVTVDSFHLYSSKLHRNGAVHTREESYSLWGPEDMPGC